MKLLQFALRVSSASAFAKELTEEEDALRQAIRPLVMNSDCHFLAVLTEGICCVRSGIGKFCQDGVFCCQDQGVTTEYNGSRFIGRPGCHPFPFKGRGRYLCRIRRWEMLVERETEIRDKCTLGEAQTEGKWVPAPKGCDLVGVKPGLGSENRRLVV